MKNNCYGRRRGDGASYERNYAKNSCPLCARGGEGACRCGEGRGDLRPGCTRRESDRPVGNCRSAECRKLMKKLQKLDFSIQETVLYLDAYPDCCEAKRYYQHLLAERREVAEKYQKGCGPLTAWGNESASAWDWTDAPWPWHPDFPGNDKD